MPREKSAGAIIFRMEGGVPLFLLLHYPSLNRKNGHWEFSKGHIEEGEDYNATVKREVAEETGLKDIKIIPGFKEHIKYFFKQYSDKLTEEEKKNKKTKWIFKLVTFFIAETKTKEIKLSPEHIGFVWLPIDEAIKKTTYKNSKLLLKKANDFINKKRLR
jgi:8-oxo-dGTP pyrophosphatase MutT (NUDIX family)